MGCASSKSLPPRGSKFNFTSPKLIVKERLTSATFHDRRKETQISAAAIYATQGIRAKEVMPLESTSPIFFDNTSQNILITTQPGSTQDERSCEFFLGPPEFETDLLPLNINENKLRVGYQIFTFVHNGRDRGVQKQNQDALMNVEKFLGTDDVLIGVFDGHGANGHIVSSFAKNNFPLIFSDKLKTKDIEESLTLAFQDIQHKLTKSVINTEFSGTTATVAYLKEGVMNIAWVGDSRAVVAQTDVDQNLVAFELVKEHKPWLNGELQRINKSGGIVAKMKDMKGNKVGPYRVWCKQGWYPGLAMSRAIGDDFAHSLGVIETPDISNLEITPDVKFAIIASDGIWEFISSQEAVDIVSRSLSIQDGCKKLADEALKRWLAEEQGSSDDITVSIINFLH